jgi:two-component system response regulator
MNNEIDILLIEDNIHEAQLAIRSFKKNNLANRLLHFDDGVEAMDFIFAANKYSNRSAAALPKLILLDLKLPKISGLDILKAIKTNNTTKHIPVIVLTASKEEPDIRACYDLGVNSYIVKPVNFDAFSKAVADLGMYWMFLNVIPQDRTQDPA